MDGTSMMTTTTMMMATTMMVGQPPRMMMTHTTTTMAGVPLPTMTIPTLAVDPRAASPVDVARAAEDAPAAAPAVARLIITTITNIPTDTGCGTVRAAGTVPRVVSLEVRVVKLVVAARAAKPALMMMMTMTMIGPPPPAPPPTIARVASLDLAEDPRAPRAALMTTMMMTTAAAGRPRAPAPMIAREESLALVEDPREASVANPVEDATTTMTGPPLAGIRPSGMVDGVLLLDMSTMTITITARVANPAVEAREASLAGMAMTMMMMMMIGPLPAGPLQATAGPRAVAAVAPSLANLEARVARADGNLALQPLLRDFPT
mmetsp:Transcript_23329/g.41812  ORF Transcript_23329/g.41812 Transcript_23329/m.41812 type:complete len:320 (-) Transcript_23329:622-1581(-)